MDDNAKELEKRRLRLEGKKATYNALCQELALQFYPERADFTVERPWGAEYATHLFNSAPVNARRDLGNQLSSMLRPRGKPWFDTITGDEDTDKKPSVAPVLDHITAETRQRLYSTRSQFTRAGKEADHDIVTFGNSIKSVGLTRRGDQLLFRCWHPRDCVWAEDADSEIDSLFRIIRHMPARQMAQEFGRDKLHSEIKSALEEDPDKEFPVAHCMLPSGDYDYLTQRPRRFPWASVYYDVSHQETLREEETAEFRYLVDRWATISGIPYGFSPAAMTSLPDARGMQILARVIQEAGEKHVDPPHVAHAAAIKGELNLWAGGTTWIDREYNLKDQGAGVEFLKLGENPEFGQQMLMFAIQQMKETWYLTKLDLPSRAKTAFETAQLVEEFIRANIPLFEPMEANNARLLDLVTSMLLRLGAFGDMRDWPPELSGRGLEFSFSNPLQDAIKRNKVNQATTVLGVVAGFEKMNPQGPGRVLDGEEIVRDVTRGTGAPAEWLVDPKVLAAADQAAADRMQQQQQTGNIVQGLTAAGQAADVANTGADAAAKLQGLFGRGPQPADGEGAYGPT